MARMRMICSAGILVAVIVAGFGVCAAGIRVSINPSDLTVCRDSTFSITIWKDSLNIEFDGYETVITYDPTMLELVSMAEEYVMTDSCLNRWWFLDAGEDTIFISHVLMCGGVTVTGPGSLSSMTFRALQEGTTVVSCQYFWLTYQGYWIKDIDWQDGVIHIGLAGIENGGDLQGENLRIDVSPNPGQTFRISLAGDADAGALWDQGILDICDVGGRVVTTLRPDRIPCVMNELCWDGCSENGRKLSPGVYFVRFSTPAECVYRKVILTR